MLKISIKAVHVLGYEIFDIKSEYSARSNIFVESQSNRYPPVDFDR